MGVWKAGQRSDQQLRCCKALIQQLRCGHRVHTQWPHRLHRPSFVNWHCLEDHVWLVERTGSLANVQTSYRYSIAKRIAQGLFGQRVAWRQRFLSVWNLQLFHCQCFQPERKVSSTLNEVQAPWQQTFYKFVFGPARLFRRCKSGRSSFWRLLVLVWCVMLSAPAMRQPLRMRVSEQAAQIGRMTQGSTDAAPCQKFCPHLKVFFAVKVLSGTDRLLSHHSIILYHLSYHIHHFKLC